MVSFSSNSSHAAHIGAIIMLGAGGETPQERLVRDAQRASTLDLICTLHAQGIERIVLAAPSTDWLFHDLPRALAASIICADDAPDQPFRFGPCLADLIEHHAVNPVLYFGGGSAPLVDRSLVAMIIGLLEKSGGQTGIPSHIVLTNNLHSSDWAAISHVDTALPLIRALNRDNSLAWSLRESGEYETRVLSSIRPATSMDIDTPSDLAILTQHPDTGPFLRRALDDERLRALPVRAVLNVAEQEGKTLALIGRVSPAAWQTLNKVARVWTRVLAEERGMVASERLDRGEVRSMLTPWIAARGFEGFFADLADMADAALFDTRVLFAAHGIHPDPADRFASDLLWSEAVRNPWVRQFTRAAAAAPIPVLLGGHSVVSGGLHALAEIIQHAARPG